MRRAQILSLIGFLSLITQYASAQKYEKTGYASYYAEKYHGRLTANGERFNMYDLTAAHRTLPFDTKLRVTNLSNGKSITVRVNDRGPFAANRILDLSKAAAQKLDMLGSGVVKVHIESIGTETFMESKNQPVGGSSEVYVPQTKTEANSNVADSDGYTVFETGKTYSMWGTERYPKGTGIQVGSYEEVSNAKILCKKLIARGYQEVYIQSGWSNYIRAYRVVVGAYHNEKELNHLESELKRKGFDGFAKKHF